VDEIFDEAANSTWKEDPFSELPPVSRDDPSTWTSKHGWPGAASVGIFGDLESKRIGPRSVVWTEPSVVNDAAYEFMEVETFISTAESILTPYAWNEYNLLVLP
jgi:hypothetical protein